MKYPKFLQILTIAAVVTSAVPLAEVSVHASGDKETPKEYEARTEYSLPSGYHYVLSEEKYVTFDEDGQVVVEKDKEKKAEPEKTAAKAEKPAKAEAANTASEKKEESKTEEKSSDDADTAKVSDDSGDQASKTPDGKDQTADDVKADGDTADAESLEPSDNSESISGDNESKSEGNAVVYKNEADGTESVIYTSDIDGDLSGDDGENTGIGSETGGENTGETGGETGGENTGEGSGDTGGENTGETGGEIGGENTGETGGETGGDNAGETGGENTGETGGETGGENTGEDSGETGGNNTGEGGEIDGDHSNEENPDNSQTDTSAEPEEPNKVLIPETSKKQEKDTKIYKLEPRKTDKNAKLSFKASKQFSAINDRICYNVEVPIEGIPSFITQEMVVGALKAQDETGFPASVTIAQIIKESGYGKYGPGGDEGQGLSYLAYQYCNLFGIKGTGTAGSALMNTKEMTPDGSTYSIQAGFRAYNTYTECIEDRSELLKRVYFDLTENVTDANTFAMRIAGRWATGINYGQSLIKTMETYDLYRLDDMTLIDFNEMIGTFANPCPGSHVTSLFGYRAFDQSFHKGLDMGTGSENIPTYAAEAGTVIFAGNAGNAGNLIIIDHGNGLTTKYMHHSQLYVKMGQKVEKGQQIGLSGTTGYSTGNHLHFQVEKNGVAVNPMIYLMENNMQAKNDTENK